MLGKEGEIERTMNAHERMMKASYNGRAEYITFNMSIHAYRNSLTDKFMEQKIKKLDKLALGVDTEAKKEKLAKIMLKILAGLPYPRICHGVEYNVFGVQVKGTDGKKVRGSKSRFTHSGSIPEDVHLKSVIE